MQPTTAELAAAILFALAIAHTFSTSLFGHLEARYPSHRGIFHLLGEVEVVFGFWALLLVLLLLLLIGVGPAVAYVDSRNFTEPLFVFAIMVVAGSKPILQLAATLVRSLARLMPMPTPVAGYFLALALIPLLGSFITEPAAMTVGALILRDRIFHERSSAWLKYATIGVLFVNVSIGGAMTPFAAPPVLMVAATWGWDLPFMLQTFGWRVALAVVVNAALATALFAREIGRVSAEDRGGDVGRVPAVAMPISVAFLAAIVLAAHHPPIFIGLLLLFIGYSAAYPRHHDPLILREALLVALFLAGLVVLGGMQSWWLQPLLASMSPSAVYYGATALTAVTDNAALTYLGAQVPGLTDEFKISLVAGAITGGGLTVIANAPNPAGFSILRGGFDDDTISAWRLFAGALLPTLVAIAAFRAI